MSQEQGLLLLLKDISDELNVLRQRVDRAKTALQGSDAREEVCAILDGQEPPPRKKSKPSAQESRLLDAQDSIIALVLELYARDAKIFDAYHQIATLSAYDATNRTAYQRCAEIIIRSISK